MPLLFTTSATAASLLIAVFAFLHRLNVDLRREAHEAMVTYYRARVNCQDEIEKKLSGTGAMNTPIGGKMDETDDYRYEWTHETWQPATDDMTSPEWLQRDIFEFYKSYLYSSFNRGTKSDALLNFADSSTLENRVFRTMKENGMDSYMWFIWVFPSHGAGSHTGVLHLQSVYASSLPKKIESLETTLRYIPWSIYIFTVVLFLSAIAIFDAKFSIFAVEAYAAGWILVLGIVKRLSSLVRKTSRKLRLHLQVKLKRRL